ncbi:Uncharacterized protein dnm_001080 [Desulfonema magnum]|uniref:Uncharacterized protein n=1 Tax=Desulfonema magnum TaxID=45655 RepID=A0A975BFI0_9BACT|nr:Uncharacterized protein dnm_001080 [Desulfonema magnum]
MSCHVPVSPITRRSGSSKLIFGTKVTVPSELKSKKIYG